MLLGSAPRYKMTHQAEDYTNLSAIRLFHILG